MTFMIFMTVCSCNSRDSVCWCFVSDQGSGSGRPPDSLSVSFWGSHYLSGSRCLTRGPIDNWPLPTIAAVWSAVRIASTLVWYLQFAAQLNFLWQPLDSALPGICNNFRVPARDYWGGRCCWISRSQFYNLHVVSIWQFSSLDWHCGGLQPTTLIWFDNFCSRRWFSLTGLCKILHLSICVVSFWSSLWSL